MIIFANIRILRLLELAVIIIITFLESAYTQMTLPRPDHIVICIEENHGYDQIIGSSAAPYINSLATVGALFGQSFGLTHPSQPNYLMLFSGANQGVTNDNTPAGTPWSTLNLGASLINSGLNFTAYSQGLPSVGSTVSSSGAYARKHGPWVNWQGTGTNQIPANSNQPFTTFPTDFSLLPTVSFVIPDQNNDIHNGTDPTTITTGDIWLKINLAKYIDWANTHNSLFILTFDEDDNSPSNQIATIFAGQMVKSGFYNTIKYNHYNLLRTIEEMYGLPYAGASANVQSILECWNTATGIKNADASAKLSFFPNPISTSTTITFSASTNLTNSDLEIFDLFGNRIIDLTNDSIQQNGKIVFNRDEFKSGIYFYRFKSDNKIITTGKIVIE